MVLRIWARMRWRALRRARDLIGKEPEVDRNTLIWRNKKGLMVSYQRDGYLSIAWGQATKQFYIPIKGRRLQFDEGRLSISQGEGGLNIYSVPDSAKDKLENLLSAIQKKVDKKLRKKKKRIKTKKRRVA